MSDLTANMIPVWVFMALSMWVLWLQWQRFENHWARLDIHREQLDAIVEQIASLSGRLDEAEKVVATIEDEYVTQEQAAWAFRRVGNECLRIAGEFEESPADAD